MSNITLGALESALAPIEAIGRKELIFPVETEQGTVNIALRILLPEEENEVQRFSAQDIGDIEDTPDIERTPMALGFIDRFRLAVLSHAMVGVGDQDLRDVEYIETGEKLESGQAIRMPRHQALRQLLGKWSGPLRIRVFSKYAELMADVEKKAERAIHSDPSDVGTEIDRLETRLEQLKSEKELQDTPSRSSIAERVQKIAEIDRTESSELQDIADDIGTVGRQAKRAQQEVPAPPAVRQSIIPGHVAVPAPQEDEPEVDPSQMRHPGLQPEIPQEARPTEPPTEPPTEQEALDASVPPPGQVRDSFVDVSDQDELRAEMAAETQRIMTARMGAGAPPGQAEIPASAINQAQQAFGTRRPPHLDALPADEELQQSGTQKPPLPPPAVSASPQQIGDVNGRPAFRMPAEPLDRPQDKGGQVTPPLNPGRGSSGSVNPRFRRPKGV